MSKAQLLQLFETRFAQFIQNYNCARHPQHPSFVCFDSACRNRGLICSLCLTVNNQHKGHDSIEIHQLVAKLLDSQESSGETEELISRVVQAYQQLLKTLSDFHERISLSIKQFITRKSTLHLLKETTLFEGVAVQKLSNCNFQTIEQLNESVKSIVQNLDPVTLRKTPQSQAKSVRALETYLQDLKHQRDVLNQQLQLIRITVEENLLRQRKHSPLVVPVPKRFSGPVSLVEKDEQIFIGEVKAGRPHGKGLVYYRSSNKFAQGQFKNGHLFGRGVLYLRNGDIYEGQFKDDKKQGRGIYTWKDDKSDALRYQGQFKNSKRNGQGVFLWNDGSRYEGSFVNGQQEGFGELFRADGSKEYEGGWQNGVYSGHGVHFFENGEVYEGQFKQDKFNGQGRLIKADSVITGEWKDSELVKLNLGKSLLSGQKQG